MNELDHSSYREVIAQENVKLPLHARKQSMAKIVFEQINTNFQFKWQYK